MGTDEILYVNMSLKTAKLSWSRMIRISAFSFPNSAYANAAEKIAGTEIPTGREI